MTGSSKQTTQTNSAPWDAAQPALKQNIASAQSLYNSGTGAGIYTGSTSTPWSKETQDSMSALSQLGYGNMGGNGLSGQYQNVINNGGYNDAQKSALAGYNGIVGTGGYNTDQNTALDNTRSLANSNFDINSNPGFQSVLSQAQRSATDAVNNNASAAGRYGSGTNQSLLASNLGDVTGNLVNGEYQNWQGRKDAANQNLFNMGQTGQSNVAGALGNISNLGQQGFNNLGAAYQGMQAPATVLAQVGAGVEGVHQNALNDQLRIFNSQQQAPWDNLSRLNAIASGAGQLGSTSTQSQPGQNPFLTALGYGATGLGFLGGL